MIIVKADADALLRGETLEEPVVEDDEGVMPYVANAIMAACIWWDMQKLHMDRLRRI